MILILNIRILIVYNGGPPSTTKNPSKHVKIAKKAKITCFSGVEGGPKLRIKTDYFVQIACFVTNTLLVDLRVWTLFWDPQNSVFFGGGGGGTLNTGPKNGVFGPVLSGFDCS